MNYYNWRTELELKANWVEDTGKHLIIVGGKAGARICYEIATNQLDRNNHFKPYYSKVSFLEWFFDPRENESYLNGTIDENVELLKKSDYFVATGNNAMRKAHIEKLILLTGKPPINIIHRKATVAPSAKIGYGNLILANSVIHTDAVVGNGCIINTAAIVEHDNVIGNYSQISPGATLCGYVQIGENCFIGANSTVIPNIKIVKNTTVGAGAVVTREITEEDFLYAGVPAEKKKKYESKSV